MFDDRDRGNRVAAVSARPLLTGRGAWKQRRWLPWLGSYAADL